MFLDFFRKNKIPLTDRKGKTIYVKPQNKDKYILTKRGWLLKDKVYVRLSTKLVPMKGIVRCIDRRTGWQIYLDEIALKKAQAEQWERFERDFMKQHNPEWLENFEKEHGRYWYRDN